MMAIDFDGFGGSIADLPTDGNKKSLLVLFIVDVTRTMEGQPISQVNVAISELLGQLKKYATDNGVNLKLSLVTFTSGVKWDLEPTDIQLCYDIEKLATRPGYTNYGDVYYELRSRLIRGDLIEKSGKIAPPLLVFLTDGAPDDDYTPQLEELKKNQFFAGATRIVVLLGDAANDQNAHNAAMDFTGAEDMILCSTTYTSIVSKITLATMLGIRGDGRGGSPAPIPPAPVPDPISLMTDLVMPVPDPISPVPDPVPPVPDPMPPVPDPFGAVGAPPVPDPFGAVGAPPVPDPFGAVGAPPVPDPFGAAGSPFPRDDATFGDSGSSPALDDPFASGSPQGTGNPGGALSGDQGGSGAPLDNPF